MKNKLKEIIKQTIDIHVHIGPEIIPRKYTVEKLLKEEAGKIGGFVLKNHFYATSPFIAEVKNNKNLKIFGSVALNNSVGGLNSEAIYGASIISEKPIMVWLPTINAENFLSQCKYEIAPEWVQKKNFQARYSKNIKAVKVTKNDKATKELVGVLKMIKKCMAILATGHIGWKESEIIIKEALKIGIKNILITHPIYQRIKMPLDTQKRLANLGCFIEQSYSMYAIDKIPLASIAAQIKGVGTKSVILSSDVGQTYSPPPSDALLQFSTLLAKEGFSDDEFYEMLVKNPKKLLNIND